MKPQASVCIGHELNTKPSATRSNSRCEPSIGPMDACTDQSSRRREGAVLYGSGGESKFAASSTGEPAGVLHCAGLDLRPPAWGASAMPAGMPSSSRVGLSPDKNDRVLPSSEGTRTRSLPYESDLTV